MIGKWDEDHSHDHEEPNSWREGQKHKQEDLNSTGKALEPWLGGWKGPKTQSIGF